MGRHKVYSQNRMEIAGLQVDVLRKNVKNLNLRVNPAEQSIRVSVPRRTSDRIIIRFIQDKLPWIRKHLKRRKNKPVQPKLTYTSGEIHFVWGEPHPLIVEEKQQPPAVFVRNEKLVLQVRPGSDLQKRKSVLKEWYRASLKEEIPKLIAAYEPVMGVKVNEFGVKQMKTRWGTCNIRARRIWLNLELVKKRPKLLEYVVVHEMVHLLERLHNKRFYFFMSEYLPEWKALKEELNGRSSISDC